ncbi:hypothetical protein [Kitasatospora sp. NPDC059571]|uniref:hypothetical protein n=1 Tax=Kitasatospora sp. NPDC059571 TaxID=3346871 RepID=UPI0036ADB2E0
MIWSLKHAAESTPALVQAQSATIGQHAAAVASVHGIDEDAPMPRIAQAVVKVDVTVGQTPSTPTT